MFTRTLDSSKIRIGLPSKGRMAEDSITLLEQCGLRILRNPRNYVGYIPQFPQVQLIFQRQEDIIRDVASGILSLGIAGFDLVCEYSIEKNLVIRPDLGFGECTLEIAVPKTWEINSLKELSDERIYRVATKFPKLTDQFLKKFGLEFDLVESSGSIEVTPELGRADFIVDLVSTGATLQANGLKRLHDGVIVNSQATLIGNFELLSIDYQEEFIRSFLELLEGTLRATNYLSLIANIPGDPDVVLQQLQQYKGLTGLQSPTISRLADSSFFAIQIIIRKSQLLMVIEKLRSVNAAGIAVMQTVYLFEGIPDSYKNFVQVIEEKNQ